MKTLLRSRLRSFRCAFTGWAYTLRTQPNARIHALATAAVITLALWLRLPRQDWALLIFAIALVWTAEMINTALETLVDLISPQPHPLAKIAKDVAAAAVLTAAIAAVLIGLLILGPPLYHKILFLMR